MNKVITILILNLLIVLKLNAQNLKLFNKKINDCIKWEQNVNSQIINNDSNSYSFLNKNDNLFKLTSYYNFDTHDSSIISISYNLEFDNKISIESFNTNFNGLRDSLSKYFGVTDLKNANFDCYNFLEHKYQYSQNSVGTLYSYYRIINPNINTKLFEIKEEKTICLSLINKNNLILNNYSKIRLEYTIKNNDSISKIFLNYVINNKLKKAKSLSSNSLKEKLTKKEFKKIRKQMSAIELSFVNPQERMINESLILLEFTLENKNKGYIIFDKLSNKVEGVRVNEIHINNGYL